MLVLWIFVSGSLTGVRELNGINVSRLLYTDQPQIDIHGDIYLKSIHVKGNVFASSLLEGCILPKVNITDWTVKWYR